MPANRRRERPATRREAFAQLARRTTHAANPTHVRSQTELPPKKSARHRDKQQTCDGKGHDSTQHGRTLVTTNHGHATGPNYVLHRQEPRLNHARTYIPSDSSLAPRPQKERQSRRHRDGRHTFCGHATRKMRNIAHRHGRLRNHAAATRQKTPLRHMPHDPDYARLTDTSTQATRVDAQHRWTGKQTRHDHN